MRRRSCRSSFSTPGSSTPPFGRSANRRRFLAESLADLHRSLSELGSSLVVRRGETTAELARLAPDAVYAAEDASGYAQARERRLAGRFDLRLHPSTTAIAFDDLKTYRVFTPYFRAWSDVPLRAIEETPPRLGAHAVEPGQLPGVPAGRSPDAAAGGEAAGRARLDWWLSTGLPRYGQARGGDDLAADHTSRLSPYLHFGCRLRARVRPARASDEGERRMDPRASAGETSTHSSCARSPRRLAPTCTTGLRREATPAPPSTRGGRVAPATRSSTRACASSRARGGCTTARDSSRRPSSSRISVSTGVTVPRGSRSCCSTGTSRRTAATGSGSPGRVSTTRRVDACSTRRCRPSAAIRAVTTFVATCPSSRTWSRGRSTSPGARRRGRLPRADRRPCGDCEPSAPRGAADTVLTLDVSARERPAHALARAAGARYAC